MGNVLNEDLKFCILRRIVLNNINAYCKDFKEK